MTSANKAYRAYIQTTGTQKKFYVLKVSGKVVEYPTRAAAKAWQNAGDVLLTEAQAREKGLIA